MIKTSNLTLRYKSSETPILRNVNLAISAGQMALVCGPTGSGKSTLLKCLNSLAPTFTGGTLTGSVSIDGQTISGTAPHEIAHLVGYVNQQPEGGFVSETVEDELVFGMEQLGVTPAEMCNNLARVAEIFDLAPVLDRRLTELSGGQQQKVAIAAAVAAGQKILLLDEPTSALSPSTAAELLSLLKKLSTDEGITVILVEHRIERVLELVDSVVMVHGDGSVTQGDKTTQFSDSRCAPPLIELSQKLGWAPVATNVSEARNHWRESAPRFRSRVPLSPNPEIALSVHELDVNYGSETAVSGATFDLAFGSITALMGQNGAGKTSLISALRDPKLISSGTVALGERSTTDLSLQELLRAVTMVPQKASDLLFLNSVGKELQESDVFGGLATGTTARLLTRLNGRLDPNQHPRDLSAGQKLSLVLAMQLANGARVLLLDEPTRGLDYFAKRQLAEQLQLLQTSGACILVASHDVEFISQIADRVLLLDQGKLIQDSAPEELLGFQKPFETQIAQVSELPDLISISQVVEL